MRNDHPCGAEAGPAVGRHRHYTSCNLADRAANARGVQVFGNDLEGRAFGGELDSLIQMRSWWQVRMNYSHVQTKVKPKLNSRATGSATEANDPKHHMAFRSSMNFPRNIEWDFWLRYVSRRPVPIPLTAKPLGGYASFDVRLGWRPVRHLDLSIVGQNLYEGQHAEFPASLQEEVKRSTYGKMTWTF